jgi:hypothetical protein
MTFLRFSTIRPFSKGIAAAIVVFAALNLQYAFRITHHLEGPYYWLPLQASNGPETLKQSETSQLLRVDWTNLNLHSPIAQILHDHYHNCSLPLQGVHRWRTTTYGLGSELHVWENGLIDAFHKKIRFRNLRAISRSPSVNYLEWPWLDEETCHVNNSEAGSQYAKSSLSCYFPSITEPKCDENDAPSDKNLVTLSRIGIGRSVQPSSTENDGNMWTKYEWRAAATEFLFSSVSPLVVQEAERQLPLVFKQARPPPSKDLIAVHVRWGDKVHETPLVSIDHYVNAVNEIIQQHNLDVASIHILLCSEDPAAIHAFRAAAPNLWNIYIDQMFTELLPYRSNTSEYNHFVNTVRRLRGKPGLWAMGSLLLTLEANYYVLGTTSNWSRLINELRKNVIDPRCNHCTVIVDVAPSLFE